MISAVYMSFMQASATTFKLMLDLDVEISPANAPVPTDIEGVGIEIPVTGDLTGAIRYRFPKQVSLEVVSIMSGMAVEQIDDFTTSALGEIANIISGNALISLSEQKISCDILPPQILKEAASGDTPAHILVKTGAGDMALELSLQ